MTKFLYGINDPNTIITPIDAAIRFPEILDACLEKYAADIALFRELIASSGSSAELLDRVRSSRIPADTRMSLLKMFRRCVSPVLDTETTKKITKITTKTLVDAYGSTFKPIAKLKDQFVDLSTDQQSALAALIGEYDTRGQLGYQLTETFFDWFEVTFAGALSIDGPRRAGKDVELSTVFPDFKGSYPCDFVIRRVADEKVLAVGCQSALDIDP